MNRMQRIYLSARAAIAEIQPIFYGLSTLIGLAVLIFLTIVNPDVDMSTGAIRGEYSYWDENSMHGIIISAGWLAATIISSILLINQFKEENRGIHTLTLPLEAKEKFVSLLFLNWVFIPIITFGPLFIWGCLAWMIAPEWLQLVPPRYLFAVLWMGPLLHVITSAIWLFPTVAFPKYSVYIILGIMASILIYINFVKGLFNDYINVDFTPTAYADPNVVGLNKYNIYSDNIPDLVVYQIAAANNPFFLFSALAAIIMVVCSAIALNRKTA